MNETEMLLILERLKKLGLVKDAINKQGKQCWYIPEDKEEDVKKFLTLMFTPLNERLGKW